jgi:hypothetical protein
MDRTKCADVFIPDCWSSDESEARRFDRKGYEGVLPSELGVLLSDEPVDPPQGHEAEVPEPGEQMEILRSAAGLPTTWVDRLEFERLALVGRIEALTKFLAGGAAGVGKAQVGLMRDQLVVMLQYRRILEARLMLEKELG